MFSFYIMNTRVVFMDTYTDTFIKSLSNAVLKQIPVVYLTVIQQAGIGYDI